MGAKDTVMPEKEVLRHYAEGFDKGNLRVAEAQAEITWDKAIREVVEFFNSMGFAQIDSAYVQEELKAKLKEWGIK